jgi:ATP-dependent DNA ligase
MQHVLTRAATYAARSREVVQRALNRSARSAKNRASMEEQLELAAMSLERSQWHLSSANATLEAGAALEAGTWLAKGAAASRRIAPPFQTRTGCDSVAGTMLMLPQIATLVASPPSGPDWVHEINFDGYRLQGLRDGQRAWLLDVNGRDWSHRFPTLVKALRDLNLQRACIDCTAVAFDENGMSSLSGLEQTMSHGNDAHVVLRVFDLLQLNGRDLRALPLIERKKKLRGALHGKSDSVQYAAHLRQSGRRALEQARLLGIEGIVSKRCNAPYRSGLNLDWRVSGRVRCY